MEVRKDVAPKAEEEGAESSSSEANGPVATAAASSTNAVDQQGEGASGTGKFYLVTLSFFFSLQPPKNLLDHRSTVLI